MGFPGREWTARKCKNDRRNIAFAKQTVQRIFETAEAQDLLSIDRYAHRVGGCRMGTDPEGSVIAAAHRAREFWTPLLADGSCMPTEAPANPALTIMALPSRLAERPDATRMSAGYAAGRSPSQWATSERSATS